VFIWSNLWVEFEGRVYYSSLQVEFVGQVFIGQVFMGRVCWSSLWIEFTI